MNRELRSARHFAHAGAWIGLAATGYTNWQAAPSADLKVAYLAVPVLLACVSEALIRAWPAMKPGARTVLSLVALALIFTSYEHYRHMIQEADGTALSANVGAAVVDIAIFALVLLTCTLPSPSREVSLPVDLPVDRETSLPVARETSLPVDLPAPASLPVARETSLPVDLPAPARETGRVVAPPSRKASDREVLEKLYAEFGQKTLTEHSVKQFLKCGGPRALRLARLYNQEYCGGSSEQ